MIIWEGPSQIDGKPIVAIVTFGSNNSKTGNMPQIWILRSDVHPTEALRTGQDVSICGNCIHRPKVTGENALKKNVRSCYVNTMSFNAIYKKYANGGYQKPNLEAIAKMLKGQRVRLGAYGDPASVPIEVWDAILANCTNTGYTHQWRTCDQSYSKYCMASCDNPIDVALATSEGWRTFYVQNVNDYKSMDRQLDNIKLAHCPASKELNKVTTCFACMACDGLRGNKHSNITIAIH
jgi:hypothetical protein